MMVVGNRYELAHNCHPIVISGLSVVEIRLNSTRIEGKAD